MMEYNVFFVVDDCQLPESHKGKAIPAGHQTPMAH
jgi:hypothetical protein